MTDRVDTTQEEFERWRVRERQLLDAIRDLGEEENRLQSELARVDQQLAYYQSLASDMKKTLGPAKLSSLLSGISRGR